ETLQLAWVVVDAVDEGTRVSGHVRQLRIQAAEPFRDGVEAPVDPRELAGRSKGVGDRLSRTTGFAQEGLAEVAAGARDRLAMLCRLEADPDLLRFARPKPRGRDLRRLVFLDRELPGDLAWIEGELREERPVGAPARHRVRDGHARRPVAAEGVEQGALGAFV